MSFSRECGYQEVVAAFEVAERRMPIYESRTKGLSGRLTRYVSWMGMLLRLVGWLLGCEDTRGKLGPSSPLCGRFPNIYVLPLDTQICSDRTLLASRWREVGRLLGRFRRSAVRLLWKRNYRTLSAEAYGLLNALTQIERTDQASLASHRFMVGLLAILSLRMASGFENERPIRGGAMGVLIFLGATYILRWMDEGAQVFHQMGMGVLENDLPRFDVSL